jgi:hypothetical protein
MPIPGFSSPFWGMYGKNAVGHPPHKARKSNTHPEDSEKNKHLPKNQEKT